MPKLLRGASVCGGVEGLESRRLFAFGGVDTTFGTSGAVRNSEDGVGINAAVLTDGRVAVLTNSGSGELDVYSSGGQLDSGFSGDGKISLANNDAYYAVKPAAGGKVLLFSASGVTRYTSAGAVDTTFGTSGTAPISFNYAGETVAADGSIYLIGDNEISKFTAAGALDSSFGSFGRIELASGPNSAYTDNDDHANSLVIAADGSIEIAGLRDRVSAHYQDAEGTSLAYTTLSSSIFLAKFTSAGAADTSFGASGYYLLPLSTTTSNTGSVQILARSDGSTLLAYSNGGRIQTVNVSSVGGGKGVLRTAGPRDGNVAGLYALSDGTVALASTSVLHSGNVFPNQLTRLTFSNKLWTVGTTTTAGLGAMKPVDIDSSGRIITVGGQTASGTSHLDQVARLTTAGDPDPIQSGIFANAQQSCLATDQAGNVYLAYYDASSKSLKFDMRDANGHWGAIETVDATPNAGVYLSIDIGKNGPGIAYFDGTHGDLKYAQRQSDGTWQIGTVDSNGSVGLYPSLYLGGGIQPYISYYVKTSGDLRVAHLNSPTDLSSWARVAVDTTGDVGRSSSIAVDPYTQRLAVAYAGAGNTVKLAELKKNGWVTSTVAQTTGGVDKISLGYERLAMDFLTDVPGAPVATVVAYYDAGPADLTIARRPAGGAKFSTTVIDTKGATGLYPTFLQNNPYYYSYGNGNRNAEQVVYWNRRTDTVLSGLDETFNSNGLPIAGASVSSDVLATGGGRFLSATLSYNGTTRVLAYLDTASGNLVVRLA